VATRKEGVHGPEEKCQGLKIGTGQLGKGGKRNRLVGREPELDQVREGRIRNEKSHIEPVTVHGSFEGGGARFSS